MLHEFCRCKPCNHARSWSCSIVQQDPCFHIWKSCLSCCYLVLSCLQAVSFSRSAVVSLRETLFFYYRTVPDFPTLINNLCSLASLHCFFHEGYVTCVLKGDVMLQLAVNVTLWLGKSPVTLIYCKSKDGAFCKMCLFYLIHYQSSKKNLNCWLYSTMDTELQASSKSLSGWPLSMDYFSTADMI